MRTGVGVYLFQSGQMYEGQWREGSKHGWSIFSLHNGQQWAGWPLSSLPVPTGVSVPRELSQPADSHTCNTGRVCPSGRAVHARGSEQKRAVQRPGYYIFQLHDDCEFGPMWCWQLICKQFGARRGAGRWAEGRPQWMQNTASADTAPSGSTAGTAADVQKAVAAAAQARSAGTEGAARFSQHWEPEGELQGSVRRTVHQAVAAAEASASLQEAALRAVSAAVKAMDAAAAAKNKKK